MQQSAAPKHPTFGRILVGSKRSTTSEPVRVAITLAISGASHLDVINAGSDPEERSRTLGTLAEHALAAGVSAENISTGGASGNPADVMTKLAEEVDAGLIVIGRGGGKPSRVVHRLASKSPCDLLIVADTRHDPAHPYQKIAIATDGSVTADRAARRGYHLARALGATVDLVFVGHPATGKLITTDTIAVYGTDVATRVHLREGDPTNEILTLIRSVGADLVVVGNKGMTGVRSIIDSVPKGVLDGAPTDVLVCRTVRQIGSELEPGEGGIIERHGEQLAAFADESGDLHTMSARCTHLGCVVAWNPGDKLFDCPCHGSQFAPDGSVISGPAGRPLPPA